MHVLPIFNSIVKLPEAKTVIVVARFLAAVVEKCPELLTSNQWDATVISLTSWMLTLKNSCHSLLCSSESGMLPLVPKTVKFEDKQRSSVHEGRKEKIPAVADHQEMAVLFDLDRNSEAVFAVAVFQLYKALHDFLDRSHDEYSGDVKMFHEKLKAEWTDVFSKYVHEAVVSTFYTVTSKYQISVGVLF
jgi:hypothetical protein